MGGNLCWLHRADLGACWSILRGCVSGWRVEVTDRELPPPPPKPPSRHASVDNQRIAQLEQRVAELERQSLSNVTLIRDLSRELRDFMAKAVGKADG